MDYAGLLVSFAEHIAAEHVLGLPPHEIGGRVFFAEEELYPSAEPVNPGFALVDFHLDGPGGKVFDDVGHSIAVHHLADAHVAECLQQELHHGVVGRVLVVHHPG